MSVQFSIDDLRTPESLERVLRQFESALVPSSPAVRMPTIADLVGQLAPLIRDQLQAPGRFPLNLQSLLPAITSAIFQEDTHANRLLLYPAPASVGAVFWETDRAIIYVGVLSAGSLVWRYAAGTYYAAFAGIPIDLGVNDVGFQFVNSDTDTNTLAVWTGTEYVTVGYVQSVTDAATVTSTIAQILRHVTTGTPGIGFGLDRLIQLGTTASPVSVFLERVSMTDVTGGSEDAMLSYFLLSNGVLTQLLSLDSLGNVGIVGDYFWQSATAFLGQIAHANTANRIYSFADADGNIVFETTALTANQLILGVGTAKVTPLGSLGTTTTVLHGNAGGAPTFAAVSLTADVTGVLPAANGGSAVAYNRIADTIARTAQNADIAATNFANTIAPGTYRVSYALLDTTADVTAGAVTLTIAWTDGAGATTVASAPVALTGLGTLRTTGVFFLQLASGNVTYAITHTGVFGTATYALYICFERLS